MDRTNVVALAAIYLRSSKDRHDVSIDAQRRELKALAAGRGLYIVDEYTDVVESGKSEHRPGFQALLTALKTPGRRWTHLLLRDTARLGRRTYIGEAFAHECRRRGVDVIYGNIPDADPISRVILTNVFRAMDEVHSLMSREKGLAGMAQNVRAGYRAGGRAPLGYRLERIPTGATREGAPVTKSRLEPADNAAAVAAYLAARAIGTPRAAAARQAGLRAAASSLIGIEWNALTYAGHTVWNVHAEQAPGGGYIGGHKRRPRDEWHITRGTHPALITDAQADALLAHLEASTIGAAVSAAKARGSDYLLAGLLRTPADGAWHGHGQRYYRWRGSAAEPARTVDRAAVDHAVLDQLRRELTADRFVRAVLRQLHRDAPDHTARAAALRRKADGIERQIQRALALAADLDNPKPALRRIDALETEREALAAALADLDADAAHAAAAGAITEPDVRAALDTLLQQAAADDAATTKDLLAETIERITLDPIDLTCKIHYRVAVDRWVSMASPRGCRGYPLTARWAGAARQIAARAGRR